MSSSCNLICFEIGITCGGCSFLASIDMVYLVFVVNLSIYLWMKQENLMEILWCDFLKYFSHEIMSSCFALLCFFFWQLLINSWLSSRFKEEFELTSSHRIRKANDMQYAFSYYFYLMSERRVRMATEVFEEYDTDVSGWAQNCVCSDFM